MQTYTLHTIVLVAGRSRWVDSMTIRAATLREAFQKSEAAAGVLEGMAGQSYMTDVKDLVVWSTEASNTVSRAK